MTVWAPSNRDQTATASPLGETAMRGASASLPGAERSIGESQRGAASAGAATMPTTAQRRTARAGVWRRKLRNLP